MDFHYAAADEAFRTEVRTFLREKLRYADAIITCCEYNRGYVWRQFALDVREIAPKLHVCHHGLDLTALPFQPDGRPLDRVVGVGRLARHKGFDYLLLAAYLLRSRGIDITVELVGEGPQRPALAALADILGISDRVRLWGWLPFAQTRDIMRGATLLVHPSDGLGDGLPNVVREAMALGTPVVASDVAGIPDALCDGCGVLVPPRDPAALADAVAALLSDPARRRDIATRARQRAEERYDMARTGPQLVEILSATRRGGSTADTGNGDYRAVLAGVSR